jgi:hypothetical protein
LAKANKRKKSKTTAKETVQPAIPAQLFSEKGTLGLKYSSGVVYEDSKEDLQWPNSLKTYRQMKYDATVASAYNAITSIVSTLDYTAGFETTPEAELSDSQKRQRELISSCMKDMDVSYSAFMKESCTKLLYGFSVFEKVFKYREGEDGKHSSQYDDGKIGWAKLAPRSQDTIKEWKFDKKVRKLTHVVQDLTAFTGRTLARQLSFTSEKKIPMKKVLHFTHNSTRGNPEGSSVLKDCYIAWRYKTSWEELESNIGSRDLNGIPVFELPPEYMAEDAPEGMQAVYQFAKDAINNLHVSESAGLVIPKLIDPISKENLFGFHLESVGGGGGKSYDTESIINRYENKILMTFLADVLKMGQDSTGSFALSDNKTNLFQVGIEAILKETLEVVNRQLIPETLKLNGFKLGTEEAVTIGFNNKDDIDLEVIGKFIQQVTATGALEIDEGISNFLRNLVGAPSVDRSRPIKEAMIGGGASKSGEGMKTNGEGTAKKVGGTNASTANKDNK